MERQQVVGDGCQDIHQSQKTPGPGIVQVSLCAADAVGLAGGGEPPETGVEASEFIGSDFFQVPPLRLMSGEVQPVDIKGSIILVQSPDYLNPARGNRGSKPADPAEQLQRPNSYITATPLDSPPFSRRYP